MCTHLGRVLWRKNERQCWKWHFFFFNLFSFFTHFRNCFLKKISLKLNQMHFIFISCFQLKWKQETLKPKRHLNSLLDHFCKTDFFFYFWVWRNEYDTFRKTELSYFWAKHVGESWTPWFIVLVIYGILFEFNISLVVFNCLSFGFFAIHVQVDNNG